MHMILPHVHNGDNPERQLYIYWNGNRYEGWTEIYELAKALIIVDDAEARDVFLWVLTKALSRCGNPYGVCSLNIASRNLLFHAQMIDGTDLHLHAKFRRYYGEGSFTWSDYNRLTKITQQYNIRKMGERMMCPRIPCRCCCSGKMCPLCQAFN